MFKHVKCFIKKVTITIMATFDTERAKNSPIIRGIALCTLMSIKEHGVTCYMPQKQKAEN